MGSDSTLRFHRIQNWPFNITALIEWDFASPADMYLNGGHAIESDYDRVYFSINSETGPTTIYQVNGTTPEIENVWQYDATGDASGVGRTNFLEFNFDDS
jgi:hypothetical protein